MYINMNMFLWIYVILYMYVCKITLLIVIMKNIYYKWWN